MKPFKIFFGGAIALILLLFVARIVFAAFIIAAIMSIVYAVYRRMKNFITYDRNGDYYIPAYHTQRSLNHHRNNEVEPLFYDHQTSSNRMTNDPFHYVQIS